IYFIVKLLFLQLYPAYICYKAIKINDPNQFGPLLTYWVVASGFLVAEYLTDIFLFWIPFYTDIKFVLLLWLILPQTKGTLVVYRDWLDPFLSYHEEYIDKTLIDIQTKARQTISVYLQTLL
ncbi:TB2/DP1, HVA22 family-domain-containing protein, partial [Phycomyces nitens]